MRPRARERHVEVIAARNGRKRRAAVGPHPAAKRIRLAQKRAVLGLLVRKLRGRAHGAAFVHESLPVGTKS